MRYGGIVGVLARPGRQDRRSPSVPRENLRNGHLARNKLHQHPEPCCLPGARPCGGKPGDVRRVTPPTPPWAARMWASPHAGTGEQDKLQILSEAGVLDARD